MGGLVAKVQAEDGSWVDPSYYGTPPPPPKPASKKDNGPATFTGVAQLPGGARSSGKCRVIRPSGASMICRIPSHIRVADGDTVRVHRDSAGLDDRNSVSPRGTFIIVENLTDSSKANPVSEVSGSPGSTVSGSTSGPPGLPSVSTNLPDLNIDVPADAGGVSLTAINDNRQVLRDINTRLSFIEVAIKALQLALSDTVSALSTETWRTSSVASRVSSVESSVNATKAVVEETKTSVNSVATAVKRAGLAYEKAYYGASVWAGMVTRRNFQTSYAQVNAANGETANAFVAGFEDVSQGDYVKVNTGEDPWYIVDYLDPATLGL